MNLVKLGRKGQVSIPKAVLRRIGVESEQMLRVDSTEDGAIILRPVGVYPIEVYSNRRLEEFLQEDTLSADLRQRLEKRLSVQHEK